MGDYRYRVKGNRTCKSVNNADGINSRLSFLETYNIMIKLIFFLIVGITLTSWVTSYKTNTNNSSSEEVVISEITTNQTLLSKSDVAKYFCNNLTEYFNTYKYYKISSAVYYENEKQKRISTAKITKQGSIYNVEYFGSAGRYGISFSNKTFYESDEIITFGRLTVLGNSIRGKVYDTFTAWLSKVEIALKANSNSYLYSYELEAAVEVEKWYNSLSTNAK
jgi:hypothetical protein